MGYLQKGGGQADVTGGNGIEEKNRDEVPHIGGAEIF